MYTAYDVDWVSYVACLRRAGVSIESLLSYVKLFHKGEGMEEERLEILLTEKEKIEVRIRELEAEKAYLETKIQRYKNYLRPFEKTHLEKS